MLYCFSGPRGKKLYLFVLSIYLYFATLEQYYKVLNKRRKEEERIVVGRPKGNYKAHVSQAS